MRSISHLAPREEIDRIRLTDFAPRAIFLSTPSLPGHIHSPDFTYDVESERRMLAKADALAKSAPLRCLLATYTGLFETRRGSDCPLIPSSCFSAKLRGHCEANTSKIRRVVRFGRIIPS